MNMLKEINKCENFGSPDLIFDFLNLCKESKNKLKEIINFYQKSFFYEDFLILDTISLLNLLELLYVKEDSIFITPQGKEIIKKGRLFFIKSFREILCSISFEKIFFKEFLNLQDINYNEVLEEYVIKNNKIPFKYSAIRNILIKFQILLLNKESNLLIINEFFIDKIKENFKKKTNKLNLEELKLILELKAAQGFQAEKFVLGYEKNRLKEHRLINKIKIISDFDVSAGYDVISYLNCESNARIFIEVKSYKNECAFFWSENEVSISKEKGDLYFLYVININELDKKNYSPLIIKNPYKNLFLKNDGWFKKSTSWYFKKKDS